MIEWLSVPDHQVAAGFLGLAALGVALMGINVWLTWQDVKRRWPS